MLNSKNVVSLYCTCVPCLLNKTGSVPKTFKSPRAQTRLHSRENTHAHVHWAVCDISFATEKESETNDGDTNDCVKHFCVYKY